MFDFLEPDDIVIIKRALSYFAQVYFEKGLYTDQNGCVDVKEECHELIKQCDDIIKKFQ